MVKSRWKRLVDLVARRSPVEGNAARVPLIEAAPDNSAELLSSVAPFLPPGEGQSDAHSSPSQAGKVLRYATSDTDGGDQPPSSSSDTVTAEAAADAPADVSPSQIDPALQVSPSPTTALGQAGTLTPAAATTPRRQRQPKARSKAGEGVAPPVDARNDVRELDAQIRRLRQELAAKLRLQNRQLEEKLKRFDTP